MAKNGNIHPTRIFKSPEELEKAFEEYKNDLHFQSAEWVKVQYVGKDATRVEDQQKVPMTLEGFKRFCRIKYGDVSNYFDNRDNVYDDFKVICRDIKEEIRENQVIGGLLGFYNPSITQRLNNISETVKSDITSKGEAINIVSLGSGIKPE